ncbi:MAG: hypothetical protein U0R44_06635 [Candidatus Micrarchaeia archaeon]
MGRVSYVSLFVLLMALASVSFAELIQSGDNGASFANATAAAKCREPDVQAVYKCLGNIVRVVSSVPGEGSTFYKPEGKVVRCPVVQPTQMGAECLQMLTPNYCPVQAECGAAPVPQVFPGQNDTAEQKGDADYYVVPGKAATEAANLTDAPQAPQPKPDPPKKASQLKGNDLEVPSPPKNSLDTPVNYLVYVVLLLGVGAVGVLFMLFRNSIADEEEA